MTKRRGNGEGAVYEANGRWCAALTVGHDGNGKRKRRYLYAETKKALLEKIDATRSDARMGLLVEPIRQTVGEYLKHWMQTSAAQRVRPTTLYTYEGLAAKHITPHIGGTRLDKLSHMHLEAWNATLERLGVSAHTRRAAHVLLGTVLRKAVRSRILARNPMDQVDKPRVAKKEVAVLSPADVRKLLETARGHRLEALFVLAVSTGARQGELFGLEWRDFDAEAGALSIQRTLIEVDGRITIGEPKTSKSRRSLDLPAYAVEALRAHRQRQPATPHPTARIFSDTEGQPLRKSNFIRRDWHPLLERAELRRTKFHALRHTHVTMLLAAGGNLKAVSERVGHSRTSMTSDVYTHAVQGQQRELADTLERMFG